MVEKKARVRLLHRDHGHEANIVHSLTAATDDRTAGEDVKYVRATARFFLSVRKAIDSGKTIVLSREETVGTEQ